MAQRNDQVFQLSLTEIAFTVAFMLLLLLGYVVFKEQNDRKAAEANLAKVQSAAQKIAALNTAERELASALSKAGVANPDAVISQLITATQTRDERDSLKKRVDDLDAKLTALEQLRRDVEKAAAVRRPDVTRDEVESALALQDEVRKSLPTERPAPETSRQEQNKAFAERLKQAIAATNEVKKENSDLRGQLAYLKNRLDARGGRDYPPCWADEATGKVQTLFAVEVKPNVVIVDPEWVATREADARALPGLDKVLSGSPHSYANFVIGIQGIFRRSQTMKCRHYVVLKSSISDAVQSDRARLMIENYFYKIEVRR